MSKFASYKFRASQIHRLMANAKGSEVLSVGAKTYLHEIYEDSIFGESPEVATIEIQKGNEVENDAIALLRKIRQKFYKKHPEDDELSNEYITGHLDIVDLEDEMVIDIKCPFRVRTWFRYTEKDALDKYYWQLLSYLWLTGYKKGEIAVCAMPTPDHLILKDLQKQGFFYREGELSQEKYEEEEQKHYNLHNFSVIEEKDRIKFYRVEFNQEDVDRMISKIEAGRQYLMQLEASESLSLAVQKSASESYLTTTSAVNSNLSITDRLVTKYREFGIELKYDEGIVGASVTQFRFTPLKKGVKIEKAKAYNADIQAVLKSDSVIIETPIPKTGQIGIQIPNEVRTVVKREKIDSTNNLVLSIGQAIDGSDYQLDLATAPHLLVAGATGSGKSVLLKTIIDQLHSKHHTYAILDPKREFGSKAISDHVKIHTLLLESQREIQARMSISDKSKLAPHIIILDEMETLLSDSQKLDYQVDEEKYPPFIQKINELKDGTIKGIQVKNPAYEEQLKIQRAQPKLGDACRELIEYIVRLGRSEKVHLICATQNPTVQNISSSIKANCPTRICLRVASEVNSRVILDTNGGEKLLGNGDMLLMSPKENGLTRLQGYFI